MQDSLHKPSVEPVDRQAGGPGSSEFINLLDVISFLRRYARTIGLFVALGLLVGSYVVANTKALYTAAAEVLIDPRISQLQREQVGDIYLPLDTAQMESQLTLLRSEGIARSVVEQLGLLNDPEFQSNPRGLVRRAIDLVWTPRADTAETAEENMRAALRRFRAHLDVVRVGISYGIQISYSAEDPQKATRIANAIASVYVRDQIEVRSRAAQAGSLWLEEKISVLRKKMNEAAWKVQEFKARRDYRLKPPAETAGGPEGGAARGTPQLREEVAASFEELDATAQTYRKLFESNLAAYSVILQRDSYPVSDARVISTAITPSAPSHPRTQLILLFALLTGLLIGAGVALVHNALVPPGEARQPPFAR